MNIAYTSMCMWYLPRSTQPKNANHLDDYVNKQLLNCDLNILWWHDIMENLGVVILKEKRHLELEPMKVSGLEMDDNNNNNEIYTIYTKFKY